VRLRSRVRRQVKRLPLGRSVLRFGWAMQQHGAFRAASAIAFDTFLSLIPLLAMSGYVISHVGLEDVLLRRLFQATPLSSRLGDVDLLRLGDGSMLTLAPLSIVVFLWLSSSGIATAMGVCETMFEAEERTWTRRRAIAMAWVLGSLFTMVLLTIGSIALTRALGPNISRYLRPALLAPLLVLVVIAFFRTAIRRPRGMRRHVWPGALATVALWGVLSWLFATYLQSIARYSLFYGSLATVTAVMLWLWLLACALLVGGEMNAQLEGVREYPPSTQFDSSFEYQTPRQ